MRLKTSHVSLSGENVAAPAGSGSPDATFSYSLHGARARASRETVRSTKAFDYRAVGR